jgi:hypothetical protein
MIVKKRTVATLAALALAWAIGAEDSKEVKPIGPPQPRVVERAAPVALPPRQTDPSWLLYQEGRRLFGEKRLGESLIAFKDAADSRASLFERAESDIRAALDTKEAKRSRGSLLTLARLLAERDYIQQDIRSIKDRAGGSLPAELALYRERSPSSPLRGLIDAALLVGEERGLSRIGDSSSALAKAATELKGYPEAEFWIGKIYLAEGESRLAELQMLKAYEMRDSFDVPEDRYELIESLAELYRERGDGKDYEQRLREIADASKLFTEKNEYYRNAMERTLAGKGIDTFMTLYRVDETYAVSSYSKLGEFYLESGRPLAVIYLAAASNALLSRSIQEIKVDEPGYSYGGLKDLCARILANRDLAAYASRVGLWPDLVSLGRALSESGYRDSGREILTIVSGLGGIEPWSARAGEALKGDVSTISASRRP